MPAFVNLVKAESESSKTLAGSQRFELSMHGVKFVDGKHKLKQARKNFRNRRATNFAD